MVKLGKIYFGGEHNSPGRREYSLCSQLHRTFSDTDSVRWSTTYFFCICVTSWIINLDTRSAFFCIENRCITFIRKFSLFGY
jgi:magnesium-transporting ATPase (P-type)